MTHHPIDILDADARARIARAQLPGDDLLQAVRLIREAEASVRRRQAAQQMQEAA